MALWNMELVEQGFAEASLDPSLWVKALNNVTTLTKSAGALLLPLTGSTIQNVPFTERLGEATEVYFRDNWHLRDERYRGISLMVARGVIDDLDCISADGMKKHHYYQEFLRPAGLRWFAGVKVSCGDELWCLSIQRAIDQDPFSESEKNQLAELSNRLSTSAAMARALGASAAAGALEAFEITGTAVVLVDRHGKVFKANQSAQRILVGDIQIKKGTLVAKDASAMAALNAALKDLLGRQIGGLSAPVILPRKGRRPLLAYPAKLSTATANALADCQAMILFVDPDAGPRLPEATLRSVFRLSAAEARLCAQLVLGESLETITDRLRIAKETSRSQLKSIFAKTGVHRQAELVALLAALLHVK
jgi:DNA-binding CsgD family transcriptional regulator